MGIDKYALFSLIANKPRIRDVELADILDCEIDSIQPALQDAIRRRDVVMHVFMAPNGNPVHDFEFTNRFMESDVYKAIMNGQKIDPSQAPINKPPTPTQIILTNTERAIQFIRDQPGQTATTKQLGIELGVDNPTPYIFRALKDGRLLKAGKIWSLGDGKAPEPQNLPTAEPNMSTSSQIEKTDTTESSPLEAPKVLKSKPHPPINPAHPADAENVEEFGCALWTNGQLHVYRNAKLIMVFTAAEVQKMRRLFDNQERIIISEAPAGKNIEHCELS